DPGLASVRGLDWPGLINDRKGSPMSIKLTDTQLVMLSAAAQRDDHCLVAPAHLKGTAPQKAANKLIAAGLVKEVKAKAGAPVWRRDDAAGRSYALRLTAAGAKAIAVDDGAQEVRADRDRGMPELINPADASSPQSPAPDSSPNEAARAAPGSRSAPRSGSKLSKVIELLQGDGATVGELIALTGWLPHTARAALTGLRKRGYRVEIDRSQKERGSAYHIATDVDVEAKAPANQSEEAAANSPEPSKLPDRKPKTKAPRAA
ncbi:MAG TPA: DUF3489 domain-containing protein, partial [Methylocystis sp.]|nr:DUF3489 domain-containing protein [Methylocystis sp.]